MQPSSSQKASVRQVFEAIFVAVLAAGMLASIATPARSAQSPISHVHGRLIDGKGKPIAVAQVLLMSIQTATVFAGAASASDGSFSFYGMRPGRYGLIAEKTPACAISHAISIEPGKTYNVLLRMPSSSRCYGPTHFKP